MRLPDMRQMRGSLNVRTPRRVPLLQVAKSALAIVAAWLLAGWLVQGPPPIFAAIAALLVVQPSVNQSFTRAVERSVGVIVGVVIAALLGLAFGSQPWVALLSAGVALVVAWAARISPGATNQIAISALLVLALGTATPNYALDRVLETLIGAAIGIVVNAVLVPPVLVPPAREKVDALGRELAASLERLADALETPQTSGSLEGLLIEARLLRPVRDAAADALRDGEDSLALNPRSGRHRTDLAAMGDLLDRFTPVVTQTVGMTRAVYDGYDASIVDEPAVRAIAEQLHRAAHDVRLAFGLDTGVGRGTEPSAAEEPALTRPLQIQTPSPAHWVLVGSMLTDLHRVHETLRGDAF
ncbi:putative membrane protein YccC [Microbacterium proteolyticum]|uniref:Putative membrane protein YccC n=1 Tax=Microbacterium proteolyticum TaxID=1572644 RepID=A0A7W5GDX2_9MICO|nr:FUSC family protein [Microbacterium proteolyticum]MBB3156356.1 putative membrane protein YccC [Microbacterium proteolyticum]